MGTGDSLPHNKRRHYDMRDLYPVCTVRCSLRCICGQESNRTTLNYRSALEEHEGIYVLHATLKYDGGLQNLESMRIQECIGGMMLGFYNLSLHKTYRSDTTRLRP